MKSLTGQTMAWVAAAFLAAVAYTLAITYGPYVSIQDPTLYARIFFNRTTGACLGLVVLTGGLAFADYVLPGQWLDKIAEDPMACMGISGVILYCLTLLLTSN